MPYWVDITVSLSKGHQYVPIWHLKDRVAWGVHLREKRRALKQKRASDGVKRRHIDISREDNQSCPHLVDEEDDEVDVTPAAQSQKHMPPPPQTHTASPTTSVARCRTSARLPPHRFVHIAQSSLRRGTVNDDLARMRDLRRAAGKLRRLWKKDMQSIEDRLRQEWKKDMQSLEGRLLHRLLNFSAVTKGGFTGPHDGTPNDDGKTHGVHGSGDGVDGDSGGNEQPDKVCDICGDVGFQELIITCSQCSIGHHKYCKQALAMDALEDWACEACLKAVPSHST
ncbi:Uncharacterized protein TCM_030957 isoform 1 [Theobroma cacao]|uniref:Uncharacterized protein isoform 1 n=1 Tax=Theobroma cacao TaxID=3641 RepID=A0A061F5W3_THECC|nr:Uncharacterized protein TCM_030957 isoform 1 [Theobroma cacao]